MKFVSPPSYFIVYTPKSVFRFGGFSQRGRADGSSRGSYPLRHGFNSHPRYLWLESFQEIQIFEQPALKHSGFKTKDFKELLLTKSSKVKTAYNQLDTKQCYNQQITGFNLLITLLRIYKTLRKFCIFGSIVQWLAQKIFSL